RAEAGPASPARPSSSSPMAARRNIGLSAMPSRSKRNIVVLLPWILQLLVAKKTKGAGNAGPRRMRHDDFIDVAALGRDEGRQETFLVHAGMLRDPLGVGNILA